MAELQTFQDFVFKPQEVVDALREKGYDLPELAGDLILGCREDPNCLTIRYIRAFDPLKQGEPQPDRVKGLKCMLCDGDVHIDRRTNCGSCGSRTCKKCGRIVGKDLGPAHEFWQCIRCTSREKT